MNNKLNKLSILLASLIVFFSKAGLSFALEIHYPTILGHSLNSTSSPAAFLCYFFSLGTVLAISVAILTVAFGGVSYLISYGRGKFTDEAKEWIKGGILGLLIIVCASLIVYTINPNLNTCNLGILSAIRSKLFSNNEKDITTPVNSYKEIPIGTLTETLLTRKMDSCLGFDQNGDPITNQVRTDDNQLIDNGPTYINHDRADCLTQLVLGAQKKAQIIAALTDEITQLMGKCDCSQYGDCQPKCNKNKGCQPTGCPSGTCSGNCMDGRCKQPDPSGDCCPSGVKEKIEHGPIDVSFNLVGNTCKTATKQYDGLDEFRCNKKTQACSASKIVKMIEQQKTVSIGGEKFKITLVDKNKWNRLNLWQQLTYFEQKIKEWKNDSKIEQDKNVLNRATATLSKCYLAISYVDLVKKYEETDNKDFIVLTKKTFYDPETKKLVDSSKYCDGFNYNNSSCLDKCNNTCPDNSSQVIQCYKGCGNNNPSCIDNCYNSRPCIYSTGGGPYQNFSSCISTCQQDCSNYCKNFLNCSDDYKLCYSQCTSNGQCALDNTGKCLFDSNKLSTCANETTDQGNTDFCIDRAYKCENGSEQYSGYQECANPPTQNCFAYTDKATCEKYSMCSWINNKCSQNYSASFFYSNQNYEKCPKPYQKPAAGSYCYNSTADPKASCQDLCPEVSKCPASSDCPSCSCDKIDYSFGFPTPNRSNGNAGNWGYTTKTQKVSAYQMVGPDCGEYSYNDDPLTFYCEDKPKWYNDQYNPDKKQTQSPNPLGKDKICDQSGEIPVGQAVDNAKNWASQLVEYQNKMTNHIRDILMWMKKSGEAIKKKQIKDYCKCGANYEGGSPICKTSCQFEMEYTGSQNGGGAGGGGGYYIYSQDNNSNLSIKSKNTNPLLAAFLPSLGNFFGNNFNFGGGGGGNGSNTITNGDYRCTCTFIPCTGSPCQQMINYHSTLWDYYKTFDSDFIDFYTKMLKEPRSDIMKQLTYSRKETNDCSVVSKAYGINSEMLSCTRVEDEQISPIARRSIEIDGLKTKGCYGAEVGKETGNKSDKNLTDNWFCCQQWQKGTTLETVQKTK